MKILCVRSRVTHAAFSGAGVLGRVDFSGRSIGKGFAALLAAVLAVMVGGTVAGVSSRAGITPARVDPYAAFRPPPPLQQPASPQDRARLQLGRMLFFDPILSRQQAISCATCHNPGLSWASGLKRPIGDGGAPMALRAPTLIDLDSIDRFGWDGKFPDVESVTFAAISGHANMNLPPEEALARLRRIPGYVAMFRAAFGEKGITQDNLARAVASFERTIRSGPAPFDQFIAGNRNAISESARRGFSLFIGRAGCVNCHSGWSFTDGSFHDIGSAQGSDLGRGRLFPTSIRLRYAFKTPTLRDVARRGPYMHDGSLPDLPAVLALYNQGGIDRPSRSELIGPLHLTAAETADLLAFLGTLTENPLPATVPILPR